MIGGVGGDAAEDIQRRMEESMQRFLSIKAALLEPSTIEKQMSLGKLSKWDEVTTEDFFINLQLLWYEIFDEIFVHIATLTKSYF